MKACRSCWISVVATALLFTSAASFSAATKSRPFLTETETKNVADRVVVAGATGRTGRLVVEELLQRDVPNVVAIVRNEEKASQVFPDPQPSNLHIVKCDLDDADQVKQAMVGADAAIWCATTGFSGGSGALLLDKAKRLLGMAVKQEQSVDSVGLPAVAECLSSLPSNNLPKVVMLSSAGVTRPAWDEEKKKEFIGAADIPIVRLNPFGILDVKRDSEEMLRQCGIDYCIVRPGGLNDKWPPGSRPVFSQGDVAVGRIHRQDVASVLVDVLSMPQATGKTFEVIALAGYPKAESMAPALSRLLKDTEGLPSKESLTATYSAMQQLLPGEKQNAAALAMGQTYEQLDKGETGRLGKRGKEDLSQIAPSPSGS